MFRKERFRHKRDNPSFSSSLLDQICRSIDDNDGVGRTKNGENLKFCKEKMEKKAWLVDKRMEHKKRVLEEFNRKSVDNDVVFFSSSSSSSDSSYGEFSSSDTESLYGSKTNASYFVPSRPKPVRASVSAPQEKPLCYEQRQIIHHGVDNRTPKSRAMKIYGDLKKMKQPISPELAFDEREKSSNGVKRTVRFSLDDEERGSRLLPVSVPTVWKIGKSPSRKCRDEVNIRVAEKSKRVEEMAREFLKDYHQNRMKNNHYVVDEDDAASDSSSDLFELDHRVLNRYREELPVYETTHVQTNRAIANGFFS
ncbi:hypothetical protein F3Y22_tig00111013pilonHSYRG00219 [Hibiscus syriacus]|uniref:Uncharacterized protein n=1 Tax=Hibiscus syriacus TaxID=106335 RepID=A0A6A2Z817_HIBSY|nr:hypothetical protein F3Y22_tig00111013pilonHSYRG00219 [Hibiscus syriacus]